MKRLLFFLCIVLLVGNVALSQNTNVSKTQNQKYEKMLQQLEEESRTYYKNADTASYGIRYLWTYKFDLIHKYEYKENRIVIVSPNSTFDTSYQSMGERKWLKEHRNDKTTGQDPKLAYHLTPSFYFYYPKEQRLKHTYRILSEEFLLSDNVRTNKWHITNEEKTIGGYHCKKATCEIENRQWYAWFTNELPYVAAPRTLIGLPGVVLEAGTINGDIKWEFEEVVTCDEHNRMFVKYPEKLSSIPLSRFPLALKVFATSDTSNMRQAGLMENKKLLPEVFIPSTGIDACNVSNAIDSDYCIY